MVNLAVDVGADVPDVPVPATCQDSQHNGAETDVDCGGPDCGPCEDGEMCLLGTDCTSLACDDSAGTCAPAACPDEVQNGEETDVDCGGPGCPACEAGEMCLLGTDCVSGVCDSEALLCSAGACGDGEQNGQETDIDCGGLECAGCDVGETCVDGSDCLSLSCDPENGSCLAADCPDDVLNGQETDLDCGGPDCPACAPGEACARNRDCSTLVCNSDDGTCAPAACPDEVVNGDETDLDCGGPDCPPCLAGEGCVEGRDCDSGVCEEAGICAEPACPDGVQNGRETDLDCGGPACPKCPDEAGCLRNRDCDSGVCDLETGMCASPACPDEVLNGEETDTDCGGPDCPPCPDLLSCLLPRDCESNVCDETAFVCVTSECNDDVMNGSETDEDCGGEDCPACEAGQACLVDGDCDSLNCDDQECAEAECNDDILNGDETDEDCGGPDCDPCRAGEICDRNRDCESDICDVDSDECEPSRCDDGVTNGSETDTDCGGSCPDRCSRGEDCDDDDDCLSGFCDGGECQTTVSCDALLMAADDPESGVYSIDSDEEAGPLAPFSAYCDMDHDGGGWTLALKLINSTNTFRYSATYWSSESLLSPGSLSPNIAPSADEGASEAKFQAFNHVAGDVMRLEWILPEGFPEGHNALYENVAGRTLLQVFQGSEDRVYGNESSGCANSALASAPGYLADYMRFGQAHQFFGVNGSDSGDDGTVSMRFGFGSNDETGNRWNDEVGMGAGGSLFWNGHRDCDTGGCGCYGAAPLPCCFTNEGTCGCNNTCCCAGRGTSTDCNDLNISPISANVWVR